MIVKKLRFTMLAALVALALPSFAACRQAAGLDDLEFTEGSGGAAQSASSAGGAGGQGSSSSQASASASASSSSGAGGMGGMGGAGGAVVTGAISCGDKDCPLGGENACCWNQPNDAGMCVVGPTEDDMCHTGDGDIRIECQSSEQCPLGTVCCGDRVLQPQAHYELTSCQAKCEGDDIVLCDTPGETAPDCPMILINGVPTQAVCKQSALLPPNYLVCGNP